jgi:hypothetical protein
MYTPEVLRMGRKYVPNFVGVYPLNKLPLALRPPANFIVNTQTNNLPGEHWLAVSYQEGGLIYAFDPFGFYYPFMLRHYLLKLRHLSTIKYNRIQYQSVAEQTCGLYCIAWLIAKNYKQGTAINRKRV